MDVQIESSWKEKLSSEFKKPYFKELVIGLKTLKSEGATIYPPGSLIFNAYEKTPWDKIKVIIIGQDPYHGPNQAMGLSFSVPRHIPIPASLKNIYQELHSDLGHNIATHGDLSTWADQGVFLLNAVLTVEHRKAGSHRKLGWQQFTDATIRLLSDHKTNLVFLLWGNYARSKKELINTHNHLVLEAAHPSPLARGAYFGSRHFSKTNEYLSANQITPINWEIT